MGRILSGKQFRPYSASFEGERFRGSALKKSWLSPSGVATAATLAGKAGTLIGGLPVPFRGEQDLGKSLRLRAAERRAGVSEQDRREVAGGIARKELGARTDVAREGVQKMGGGRRRHWPKEVFEKHVQTGAPTAETATLLEKQRRIGEEQAERRAPRGVTVRAGDTMGAIARDQGVTLEALIAANRSQVPDPNRISVGQELQLPGGAPTEVAEERRTIDEPGGEAETFSLIYENLRDPDKRSEIDQATLEAFYKGLSMEGKKGTLARQGVGSDVSGAAQELAYGELSRRARPTDTEESLTEEVIKEGSRIDEVIDEEVLRRDPVLSRLRGLTVQQARSKILVAAKVADTKAAQDVLRNMWEILDPPREKISDLFKSSEQIHRDHRKHLEDRFAKLVRPKVVSEKDQAAAALSREKTSGLRKKRLGGRGGRGRRKGSKINWMTTLKDMQAHVTAGAQVAAIDKRIAALRTENKETEKGRWPPKDTAKLKQLTAERRRVDLSTNTYIMQIKKFRARLTTISQMAEGEAKRKALAKAHAKIDFWAQGKPFFRNLERARYGREPQQFRYPTSSTRDATQAMAGNLE